MKNRYLMLESSKKNKNKVKSKLLESATDKTVKKEDNPNSNRALKLLSLTNGK
ncbi:hypothetical protein EVB64_270 [Rhizobium phage RHph_TM61]|nr:hypothetical protein EVB64_270 [Rhizobium phage RHph_TM61]